MGQAWSHQTALNSISNVHVANVESTVNVISNGSCNSFPGDGSQLELGIKAAGGEERSNPDGAEVIAEAVDEGIR